MNFEEQIAVTEQAIYQILKDFREKTNSEIFNIHLEARMINGFMEVEAVSLNTKPRGTQ